MLNRLIEFSLRNRLFVLAAAALLLIYSVTTALKLPVDVFPDLNRPTVTILSLALTSSMRASSQRTSTPGSGS